MSVSYYRDYLSQLVPGMKYLQNVHLSDYTSFRLGGKIPLLVLPKDEQELIAAIRCAHITGTEVKKLGGGSNVLVRDEGCAFPVIRISGNKMKITDDGVIEAYAGSSKAAAAVFAAKNSLTGAEFMHGIPGTVGGGVYMNAGAYGCEMSQIVESVTACDKNGILKVFSKDECNFGYRHSIFTELPEYTIISVRIKLEKGENEAINAKMNELAAKRREKQPLEYPSAGSTFKRPDGYFAGKLIEDAGMKGFTIGGARVSEKHAGFVINRGGASAKDVLEVIEEVRKTVLQKFGVELEREIELW